MNDYFDRVGHQLETRVTEAGSRRAIRRPALPITRPRIRPPVPGTLATAASLAVVVAVIVALAGLGHHASRAVPAAPATATVRFMAVSADGRPLTAHALAASAALLALRLHATLPRARVSLSGQELTVTGVAPRDRAELLRLAGPGRVELFDWEAGVVAPDARAVALGLGSSPRQRVIISQGTRTEPPGAAGGLRLDVALALAGRVRGAVDAHARPARYYLLAPSGGPACVATAQAAGHPPVTTGRCLLAGPAPSGAALRGMLPQGVSASEGQVTAVGPGVALLQAGATPGATPPAPGDPSARFFVVRGPVSLTRADLVRATASSDAAGSPDVQFGFTPSGARAFQAVTARIAHRGALVSPFRQALDQHFAVAIDGRIISVPPIDFRTYPDGVMGTSGAEVTGGLDRASARALAALLRSGPLRVVLVAR